MTTTQRIFIVINPKAGSYVADTVRNTLERDFPRNAGHAEPFCEIHETGHDEQLVNIVREACARGFAMVVAAGGDGTVSGVAEGLVGTDVPLGILPLGTANVLARELGIPVDLGAACALLAGAHRFARIDAMRVGEHCYFTQVGVGIDAIMIRDTPTEKKKRFGRLAYIGTALRSLFGFQPRRFRLTVDGAELRLRASQVLVANSGILGQPPLRWGPDIRPDDGRLDVCVVRARNLFDYAMLAWHVVNGQHRRDHRVRYLTAREGVTIETLSKSLPVQADGEIIGETPVTVKLVASAVEVIVPADHGADLAPGP
ncbi:MAG: diacylglycerol kinase family lipid kinase [Isosphaeraceae bacterium]|nr:diacylglycerol kinase family lipid kinase [Isosphaeraceae bacterium]